MNSWIPLLFALLLIKHRKLKEDINYRFSVLSIVGVTFFFILQFVDYYFSIFDYPDIYQTIVKILIIVITVAFCLSPIIVRSNPTKAGICITLFALGLFFSFLMDRPLKVYIADAGGYFKSIEDEILPIKISSNLYKSEEGGYSLRIPDSWEKRKTETHLTYFVELKDGEPILELRPRCFHDSDLVITEVVQNIKLLDKEENRSSKIQCSGNFHEHSCLVKSIGNEKDTPQERWRWLSMNIWTNQNIDIDILMFSNERHVVEQIRVALASVTITPLQQPKPICLNPIEWF